MNKPAFLVLAALVFLAMNANAAYVQVFADGGPFVTDQNILVIAKVFDNNGSAKNNIDLNVYEVSLSNGVAHDSNYFGSTQGVRFKIISKANAGDYNIVAVDLNDSVSAMVTVSVRSISGATGTFYPHDPPFSKSLNEDINYTLQAKSSTGADQNSMLVARLRSDANNGFASPSIDVNANGFTHYTISTSGLTQGLYFIDVNSGLARIPVTVFQFKGFLTLQDDQNNSTNIFGRGKLATIIGKATNFDGNVSQTISSVSVSVRNPSGDSNSTIPCATGTSVTCLYVVPSDANSGDYTVTMSIVVGGNTLTMKKGFSVQTYQLKFFPQSFSGGSAGKEKMPSVYPANSDVNLEAHFIETSSSNELSGSDINTTFCTDQNIVVYIQKVGDKNASIIPDTTTWSSSNSNYCLVKITAPSVQSNYLVTAEVKVGGQTLKRSTILVVQNFLIFLSAVAPDTYDPNTPSGKFGFFKGESVGFNPSYVDLNGSLSPKIVRVRQIQVAESSSVKTFQGSDVNWNTDKNILSLSASAINTLSGGFKPVTAIVDVNMVGAQDSNSVSAFGMFKLNVMSLSAVLVDSNAALTSSQKSEQFGPPSVSPDENIYIKVTATSGSNGVSGATVSLKSFRNMDMWQELDTGVVSTKVTDANGVGILDIGTLTQRNMPTGGYLVEVQVTTTDGNIDSTATFFDSRRFVVFLQPVDRQSGTRCSFADGFRKDQNASFVVRAFNPRTGFGAGDLNVTVSGIGNPLSVSFFGSPSKPLFPPTDVNSMNYDVNSSYSCQSQGGPGGSLQALPMVTIRRSGDGNWTNGFYNIRLSVDSNTGGRENGRGFMRVQSFGFSASPNKLSQFGAPTGKPGGAFDINVTIVGSTTDVNITAKLVDIGGGGKFEFNESGNSKTTDLNIGFNSPALRNAPLITDCNSVRCPNKKVQVKALNNAQLTRRDVNVLSVIIPSNAKQQDYLLQLTATDASGNTSESEVFLTIKLYKVVNFGWFNTLFGVFGLNSLAPQDWNTSNVAVGQAYQYTAQQGGGQNGPPSIDFNFIVDYNNKRLVVDINADRNFMSAGDSNAGIGQDINNMFRVADISRVGSEPGVKFIRKSAIDRNESTFGYIGVYPADININIPIMVKDVNGDGISGAKVIVSNIARFTSGSFFPQTSAQSCSGTAELLKCEKNADFNSWFASTDANGFALPTLNVHKAGTFMMLELTITSPTGSVQRLQPFDGPTIDVKKYTVSKLITGPSFTVNHNLSNGTGDVNTNGTGLVGYTADVNYGKIIGSDSNNGILGDVNDTTTFYFMRMFGASDNAMLIDDDTNLARNAGPNYADGNAAEAGDFIESLCYDFNSDCAMVRKDGTQVPIYFDRNATDSNIFSGTTVFYPVYTQPFNPSGTTAPNHDANIQVAVSLTDLSGNRLPDTYSITGIRLENFATFSTITVTPSSYSNKTGTTLIDLGSFSGRKTAGSYNVVFTLTVSGTTTDERAFIDVRRPS